METTPVDLESEALKRKKRLEALRQLKEQQNQQTEKQQTESAGPLPGYITTCYQIK